MSSALLRLFRTTQPRIWSQPRPCLQRSIRYFPPALTDLSPEPPSLEEIKHEEELAAREEELAEAMEKEAESAPTPTEDQSAAPSDTSFKLFMKDTAPKFKFAAPNNWLGGNVPFPLNRSFVPPPPISDKQRSEMYRLYMLDPEKYGVRALSQKFHVSLDRVDAILRLKGMENAWVKGNTLQTGFVTGMERILGVPQFTADAINTEGMETNEATLVLRHDVHEADMMEEAEKNDPARQRYQRMYWESLPEFAGEATVPASLERSRRTAERLAAKAAQAKARKYLPVIPDTDTIQTPKALVQVSSKAGRPDIHFIDVGTKFLDVTSETKRLAHIETRARFRAKKVAQKQRLTV
ncbi:eukaryotic mitochondrial regulator protein-domain-containing protein [Lentinula edodes]|uniref:Eukaryotic mitochondrial regulator protein-domain-containing protein n=1 Tax=Lentinula lateritia TaxID=40482 RepID=A0A9W9DJT9_9AGAR|nr:eukaryotic mitochondrial regulator protein-domain-containing protein [Lentinula edodes]